MAAAKLTPTQREKVIAAVQADPWARKQLEALYQAESGGDPNVVYGGARFDDYSAHPYDLHRDNPDALFQKDSEGRYATAAGLGQITHNTFLDFKHWADPSLPVFHPDNQERMVIGILADSGVVGPSGWVQEDWANNPKVQGRFAVAAQGKVQTGDAMSKYQVRGPDGQMVEVPPVFDMRRYGEGDAVPVPIKRELHDQLGFYPDDATARLAVQRFHERADAAGFNPAADPRSDPQYGEARRGFPEGNPAHPLDLPIAGGIPKPDSLPKFEPKQAIMDLAASIQEIVPELEGADKLLRDFAARDFAPQAPLPPILGPGQGAGGILAALFRGFGGEQAVQNDAQNIATSMNMLNQVILANLQQQGYKTMRDADTARARADLEKTSVIEAAKARRAAIDAQISEQQRAENSADSMKMKIAVMQYDEKLRNSFGKWLNDPEGGIAFDDYLRSNLGELERFSYDVEFGEKDGEIISRVKENQVIDVPGPDGNTRQVPRRGVMADQAIDQEIANLKDQVVDRVAAWADQDAAQEYIARKHAQINRMGETLKQNRALSEAKWLARYGPNAPKTGLAAVWERFNQSAGGLAASLKGGEIPRPNPYELARDLTVAGQEAARQSEEDLGDVADDVTRVGGQITDAVRDVSGRVSERVGERADAARRRNERVEGRIGRAAAQVPGMAQEAARATLDRIASVVGGWAESRQEILELQQQTSKALTDRILDSAGDFSSGTVADPDGALGQPLRAQNERREALNESVNEVNMRLDLPIMDPAKSLEIRQAVDQEAPRPTFWRKKIPEYTEVMTQYIQGSGMDRMQARKNRREFIRRLKQRAKMEGYSTSEAARLADRAFRDALEEIPVR